jgi:hypothetical protein
MSKKEKKYFFISSKEKPGKSGFSGFSGIKINQHFVHLFSFFLH